MIDSKKNIFYLSVEDTFKKLWIPFHKKVVKGLSITITILS